MKYIKSFKLFEAIILPDEIKNDKSFNNYEDFVSYGKENDFDVVEYDEFYNSLGDADKANAPSKNGPPFFALFHPIRKKPMFVICSKFVIISPNFKETVDDIIGHEKIHGVQTSRRGEIEFNLPNPMNRKAYFSNKEEVMAFSFSIAKTLSRQFNNLEDVIDALSKETRGLYMWNDIKRNCDEKTIKRYKKYIYLYLKEMIK